MVESHWQSGHGGSTGKIVLLDPNDRGGYTHKIVGPLGGSVFSLLFSEDGTYLAAAGRHHELVIWNANTLEKVGALPVDGVVRNIQLEERKLLVTTNGIEIWNFLSEEEAIELDKSRVAGRHPVVTAIGVVVAVMVIYAVAASGAGVEMGGEKEVTDSCGRLAILSPDTRYLIDRYPGSLKETIRIINLESRETVKTLNPPGSDSCDMVFSPDGSKLLIANRNGAILYDTSTWSYREFELKEIPWRE